jgi:hypothetical protein
MKINDIRLVQLPRSENLLECDQAFVKVSFLNEMWMKEESHHARNATHAWQIDPYDTGMIYYITASVDGFEYIVGLTGWFEDSETTIGVRWHCVHPDFRGKSISKKALLMMLDETIPRKYSFAYESATDSAVDHFIACGFTKVTNKEVAKQIRYNAGYDGTALQYKLK